MVIRSLGGAGKSELGVSKEARSMRLRLVDTLDTRDARRLDDSEVGMIVFDAEGAICASVQGAMGAIIARLTDLSATRTMISCSHEQAQRGYSHVFPISIKYVPSACIGC